MSGRGGGGGQGKEIHFISSNAIQTICYVKRFNLKSGISLKIASSYFFLFYSMVFTKTIQTCLHQYF